MVFMLSWAPSKTEVTSHRSFRSTNQNATQSLELKQQCNYRNTGGKHVTLIPQQTKRKWKKEKVKQNKTNKNNHHKINNGYPYAKKMPNRSSLQTEVMHNYPAKDQIKNKRSLNLAIQCLETKGPWFSVHHTKLRLECIRFTPRAEKALNGPSFSADVSAKCLELTNLQKSTCYWGGKRNVHWTR